MKTEALSESSLEGRGARTDRCRGLSNLAAAAEARDAAESLVVLGHLGAARRCAVSRRLSRRRTRRCSARRDEWSASAVTGDAWLRRIAALDASSWWLDLVALRAAGGGKRLRPGLAFRDGLAPRDHGSARAHTTAASQRLYAEVVGIDDDPGRLALERGAVVARLFDGEIEVFVGLRPDQDDLRPAFCVVRRGGGVAGITHVAARRRGRGQGSRAGGLHPAAAREAGGPAGSVVRMGDREEALAIELVAETLDAQRRRRQGGRILPPRIATRVIP